MFLAILFDGLSIANQLKIANENVRKIRIENINIGGNISSLYRLNDINTCSIGT
jgi:hypothetical protein